jgi:hypothetical protein
LALWTLGTLTACVMRNELGLDDHGELILCVCVTLRDVDILRQPAEPGVYESPK